MKKINKEITIATTETYRVYWDGARYVIEYAERNPMNPLPWYNTLDGVQEALYYAGLTDNKTIKLGA
jgi:hypothetical protein